MKNLKFNSIWRLVFIIPILALVLSSCSDDDTSGTGVASIDSVSLGGYKRGADNIYTPIDSLTTTGFSGNFYVIRGKGLSNTKAVYFNDFNVYFNPTLTTDTNILLTLPVGVPYSSDTTSNKLKVVLQNGQELFYDFKIGAPAPSLTKYPLGGSAGTVAKITGTDFVGVMSVKFGTIPAEIVATTEKEITVKIPEGITSAVKIIVETAGGKTESALSFGFNYMIYDDARNADWWEGSWGGAATYDASDNVRDGSFSVKKEFSSYGGFQIGNGGAAVDMTKFTKVKMSLFAKNAGKVNIAISGNAKVIDLVPGVWTDYEFSLQNDFANPVSPGIFLIQEFSGIDNVVYIDNVGFL